MWDQLVYTQKYKIHSVDFYSFYYVQLVRLVCHYGLSNLKTDQSKLLWKVLPKQNLNISISEALL